jgi:hypothetical protein
MDVIKPDAAFVHYRWVIEYAVEKLKSRELEGRYIGMSGMKFQD